MLGAEEVSGSITFTVPGAPQGKGRPRVGKIAGQARMFTPAKTVAYEGLIAHAAQTAMSGRPLLDGPVACAVHIDCAVPASWSRKKQRQALAAEILPTTKPDADNVVKAIFDGCNGVLWRDDVLIVDLVARKRYGATPGVRVMITAVGATPAWPHRCTYLPDMGYVVWRDVFEGRMECSIDVAVRAHKVAVFVCGSEAAEYCEHRNHQINAAEGVR